MVDRFKFSYSSTSSIHKSTIKSEARMDSKDQIVKELEDTPETLLREVLDYVQFLKRKYGEDKMSCAIVSESSLRKDWLREEEDEAWKDL